MDFRIPLFKVNFDQKEEEAILQTIRSKWLSMGPKCRELEDAFSRKFGTEFALSASNCTSALHLSMLALGIGVGDEVICPSLSFVATANSIKYVGATPVFCDIESIKRPVIDQEEVSAQ